MKNCGKSYSVLFLIPRGKKDLELSFEFSFLARELDTKEPEHRKEQNVFLVKARAISPRTF